MDRSRIETHIKPLLGSRMVSGLTLHDIEGMQADIAAGKSARGRKGRGGRATGGAGVAGRTIGTQRGLLGHAARLKIVSGNPAEGVRQLAGERRQPRLNGEELRQLGKVLREAAAEGEHPTGLAAIRLLLLTGFRRMEVLALERRWFSPGALHSLPGHERWRTASGDWTRSDRLHRSATKPRRVSFRLSRRLGRRALRGIVRVLDRICAKAELDDVTPHVLRHTFASIAGDLGFSELTIAGLLGHSARGVTQATYIWTAR
jgi:integrase